MAGNPIKHYIGPLLRITNALRLTPTYNFNSRKLEPSVFQKITVALIICLMLGSFAYNTFGKAKSTYSLVQSTTVVADMVYCLCLTVINVLSLIEMNFSKPHEIAHILRQLSKIDEVLGEVGPDRTRQLTWTLCLNLIYCMAYSAYDAYVWIDLLGVSMYQYYVALNIQRVFLRCLVVLLYALIDAAGYRYERINNILHREKSFGVQTLQKIRVSIDAYNKTMDVVESINRLFGWQLFFLNVFLMAELLVPVNIIIILKGSGSFIKGKEVVPILLLCAVWITSALYVATKLSASCRNVSRHANKTSSASYNLIQKMAELSVGSHRQEMWDNLLLLAQNSSTKPATFSAAGFFNVDYTMLFTLVTSITTYFIVLLQFNK